jgi:cytochrome P450
MVGVGNMYPLVPTEFLRKNLRIGFLKTLWNDIDTFKATIQRIISERYKSKEQNNDILSLIIQESKRANTKALSDSELTANSFVFLVAGKFVSIPD